MGRGAGSADNQYIKQNRLRQNTQPIFGKSLTVRGPSATDRWGSVVDDVQGLEGAVVVGGDAAHKEGRSVGVFGGGGGF